MDLRTKMGRACPTLKELDAIVAAQAVLINELKADHNAHVAAATAKINAINALVTEIRSDYNAHVAAITAKLNLVIASDDDVRAKFTLHRAAANHPDAAAETALAGDAVTAIATDANLVAAAAVADISTSANLVAAADVSYQ